MDIISLIEQAYSMPKGAYVGESKRRRMCRGKTPTGVPTDWLVNHVLVTRRAPVRHASLKRSFIQRGKLLLLLSYYVHNGAVTAGKSRKLKTQRLREINETFLITKAS